eukprot:1673589-Rhodomonas_salina.3
MDAHLEYDVPVGNVFGIRSAPQLSQDRNQTPEATFVPRLCCIFFDFVRPCTKHPLPPCSATHTSLTMLRTVIGGASSSVVPGLAAQGGFRGFTDPDLLPPVVLTPKMVEDIHNLGGTYLGSNRGCARPHVPGHAFLC